MDIDPLLNALFGPTHDVSLEAHLIRGTAKLASGPVTVLGTSGHAAVGAGLALALASGVLDTVTRFPQRPIVLLVDTSGQALSRHEELLGINGYLAHLASCIDVARRRGHPIVSLVYGEAVSGGYLSFGLMADRAYAIADAQVRVMDLRAMARVTKIAHERLVALAKESPVFAPGAENYARMGALDGIWSDPSADLLEAAIAELRSDSDLRLQDRRSRLGAERGGRCHARPTVEAVQEADR